MMRGVDPGIAGKGFVILPEECSVGDCLGVRGHFVMLLIC